MAETTTLRIDKHPLQGGGSGCQNTETCEKCGKVYTVGAWPYCPHQGGVGLVTEKTYPFVTKHFNGQEIEVTSRAHEKALMQQYGVVKRDDVAYLEKEYLGYNPRTDKQEYKEANGMGMPGCWF
jgi:hypothetical protein